VNSEVASLLMSLFDMLVVLIIGRVSFIPLCICLSEFQLHWTWLCDGERFCHLLFGV